MSVPHRPAGEVQPEAVVLLEFALVLCPALAWTLPDVGSGEFSKLYINTRRSCFHKLRGCHSYNAFDLQDLCYGKSCSQLGELSKRVPRMKLADMTQLVQAAWRLPGYYTVSMHFGCNIIQMSKVTDHITPASSPGFMSTRQR